MPRSKSRQIEHEHQVALFSWAAKASATRPVLRLLYAIPNAGKRSPQMAAWYKAEGLRPGMLDTCLPVPRKGFSALYIELKIKPNRPSPEQLEWMQQLGAAGNYVALCWSWEEAKTVIENYLDEVDHA